MTLVVIIVVVIAALAIWWGWPKWEAHRRALKSRDPKARADVEDNFRKTLSQLLGGAAVLIGAWLTFQTVQTQINSQQQAARDLLISNQVSKGFEQLASDKIAMRLGGIYALEGVLNTSEEYHRPVLEGLSAFVRENATEKTAPPNKPATDVQAALSVIGRRKEIEGEGVDLANVSIGGANLLGAYLTGANLSGANLSDADLGDANLSGANLRGANLRGAGLVGADLVGADLNDANLLGAYLVGANLLGAHLSGANLSGANLSGANLRGANLRGANLSDADLNPVNLRGADLVGADLSGADLFGTNLSGADLTGARLDGQRQLDQACGTPAKLPPVPPGLALDKPCPPPK
jgi:uncharacterized protein YjbI with pentapeptide repeats